MPIKRLEASLEQTIAGRPRRMGWGSPRAMSDMLEAVWASFGSCRAMAREQKIGRGLMAFRIQGETTDFVHLKYACQGVALSMDWESRRLLADRERLSVLLERVREFRHDPRRFHACYKGLFASFLSTWEEGFPLDGVLITNREVLKDFLVHELNSLPPEYQGLAGELADYV